MATKPATFDLPDAFSTGRVTDVREEMLQLLYDEPGHTSGWYAERATNGASENYVCKLKSEYPDIVEHESGEGYRLTDHARRELIDAGVIEKDDVSESQHVAEEPSQQAKPGEITVNGVFDATGGESGAGQLFEDRPYSPDDSDTDMTDDQTETEQSPLQAELDPDLAFDLIRSADAEMARALFDSIVE